jgi:muramoyltetrapeptide carboxypeptidase LdcA involved in peptidoglycan recycling
VARVTLMFPRPDLVRPPTLQPGDKVAILSPSWAGPGAFPRVQDLGLQRLREQLRLEPVEYPTTRKIGATPQERAADIHAAFADTEIKAVMASIGGSDQLKVLRYLDPVVLQANPKAFFGYSDNTNLLIYLWNLGITGFYGGSTMVHLARPGRLHPTTVESMRSALFEPGEVKLSPVAEMTDENPSWEDPAALETELAIRPGPGWIWAGEQRSVTGPTWGGCLEILDMHLRAGSYLLPPEAYAGCVLLLETSEEMPGSEYVYRVLMGMGERGMLQQFAAVAVATPKAWDREVGQSVAERTRFAKDQRKAMLRALEEYNPGVPTVFGLDFGHTDPQVMIPYGGSMTVDGISRTVRVTY